MPSTNSGRKSSFLITERGHPDMDLVKFLSDNKDRILKRWFNLILDTYPPESASLLKREKNQFANPIGHSIREGIGGLYRALLGDADLSEVSASMDRIVRIRAIQDFSPADAIAFVLILKRVIRDELGKADVKATQSLMDELLEIESRIDRMALLGVDIYVECREKLYEIRINEVKNRTQRLLQRANLIAEIPERGAGQKDKGFQKL